ncbi:MAG: DUF3737 family protein [Bacteroidales bacterium]|nr:DUF3737 family protein [Bacteroidales bacterium]
METIKDQYFEGERPLYARRDGLRLENVKIGPGESSLKEGADIEAINCEFAGKYPFWECDGFTIRSCIFREGARAALWYTRGCKMYDTLIEAPKMFRRITDTYLENVKFTDAQETFWDCDRAVLKNVEAVNANYIFMHTDNIEVDNFRLQGNYSFQYSKNVVIRNSNLDTKDAFWESENVTVYNSRIQGEFLGWYSKNLRLVNCHIGGTQPLCYCENLILENCTFEPDADLAFEYSSVQATVDGHVVSVKNPRSGFIKAGSIGQIILDRNIKAPGNCRISSDN